MDTQVVIAGGGPTGLMLAAELALAGVDALIVERRATQAIDGSRAGGLLPRTLEVLDQRGIVERFVAEGTKYPSHGFSLIPYDVTDLPTRHNYVLGLWQSHFERILARWVLDELGVAIRRSCEVIRFSQDDDAVRVALSDGTTVAAHYLVGCDGGRSFVRKHAGIAFDGLDASTSWMLAEVKMTDEPPFGFRPAAKGNHAIGRRGDDEPIHVVLVEDDVDHDAEPTFDDLRALLTEVYGTDFGVHSPTVVSRFTDATRQAATYRDRRVFLAGDAAHIHPPQGGQGMGTGVQDAVNLGWKLARVLHGKADDDLLDTYTSERHPVGARVLKLTEAMVALGSMDPRHQSLRDTMTEVLALDEPRRLLASQVFALDLHYDLGDGDPLLGRRMPDLDIVTDAGLTRIAALLHRAEPVVVSFGAQRAWDVPEWPDARVVDATADALVTLPVVGTVTRPEAVLIRPDGYVAWTA